MQTELTESKVAAEAQIQKNGKTLVNRVAISQKEKMKNDCHLTAS